MTAFLEINQDYLLFISGLAFALTGFIARALGRVDQQSAWRWLGWFGFSRSLHAWFEMLRLVDLRVSETLAAFEPLILGVSCLFLIEFARCLTAPRFRNRPGRWIHLPLLLTAGAVSFLSTRPSLYWVYVLLNPFGGLWAACALWQLRHSSTTSRERLRWKIAAIAMLVGMAGLTACAILTETASVLHSESIILASTALAAMISISLGWCYGRRAQSNLATEHIDAWRTRRTIWIAIACVTIVSGWIAAEAIGHRRDQAMRRDVLARCQLVAATIPPALAHSLDWGDRDLEKPAYQELKARMIALRKANPDLRFVLLAGLLDGQCYFVVDSEPPESTDYSPPGQLNATLVESSPNCVQLLDLDGRCLTINQRGLVALGCPASTVIGRPFAELWPSAVRPQIAASMRETALGKTTHVEAGYVRPDGRHITWHVSTNPVRDASGKIRCFVCIATDITQAKNHERTLLAAKDAAEAADRAKSEFLAVMSHEIRTPLGGVIGMLEILRRQQQSPDQRRYTDMAHGSAEALLEILDDILDAAKVESGKLHLESIAFRVQDEFLRVLEVMKLRAEAKKLSLDWSFDSAIPVALIGDPTRLRQVLANLLSNAIKFTAAGGVTVAFQRAAEIGEKISLTVKVTDTGIGISPEARAKLFGKFVQADASTTRSFGGTGLGLSIVKGLIEQMGGTVTVESTLGKGTTFTAQIPLPVASENQLTELAAPQSNIPFLPPHARALRLLCAEDDAVQRAIAESQAREMGHTIVFAFNGAEALEKLRHADFDAVLMDNRMPVMDGFQATRAIRAGEGGVRQPLIPIIAITANASIAYRDECLAAGMNDFLTKPLRRADFHRALADVIHASFAASDDETIVPDGLTEAELLAMLEDSPASRQREESVSAKIAALFFEETTERFAEMHTALKNKDARTFARAAHSVKSTSLYIHAHQLSEIAAQLEKFADAGQFEALPTPLTQAETLFAGLLARHQRHGSNTPFSAT